jgi:predicted acylesterase/phospholipase RssA
MSSSKKTIGLALSGGGFRASLYHLGLVRFLRDAGILSQVSHITSVSGGSILAAHMLLNWNRYNGSPDEFDAAAAEFLEFVRLDVRNRVIRRFPFALPLRLPARLLGRSTRKLSRTGLLEYHYEKFLYGDTSLFELPERPQLHILATNLSEGCLCSFNRNGLMMVRRQPTGTFRIHNIHIGLATVAMAVTASSAFPGFFPPLELTGAEVGATDGEFERQAYTDGGIFDNLGVRMFRCLERPLLAETPLCHDDFLDFRDAVEVVRQARKSAEETPLRRLTQLLTAAPGRGAPLLFPAGATLTDAAPPPGALSREELVVGRLGELLRHYQFHRDPLFANLNPADPDAESLLRSSALGDRDLDPNDQLWLNRHLLEAAFRQATGRGCFRRLNSALDCVLVSDVGKPMEVKSGARAGGLIRTALRSTDILMDRVWQLEIDTFHDTPGFVFAPVTDVVEPSEDPTALHPEIQRQAANIRTDLDRFSPLEISTLVRHGYCVGRKACRARPDVFGEGLPSNAPWDTVNGRRDAQPPAPAEKGPPVLPLSLTGTRTKGKPATATVEARTLRGSAVRRIWSTLLDYRDWVSYVYVPIIVPLLVVLPYVLVKVYHRMHMINKIVESISGSSQDLAQMRRLLEGEVSPFPGETPEEVHTIDEPDLRGFKVLQDMHILDLRNWKPAPSAKSDPHSMLYGYRRVKVVKAPDAPEHAHFSLRLMASSPNTIIRFPPQKVPAKLRMAHLGSSASGQEECRWEANYYFETVPVGEYVDLIFEDMAPGQFVRRNETSTTLSFEVQAPTAELTRWYLLPKGREYGRFDIIRYPVGKPDKAEDVKIVNEYLADDYTVLAFKLLAVDPGYVYEVSWYYK